MVCLLVDKGITSVLLNPLLHFYPVWAVVPDAASACLMHRHLYG
jgi:hypothetical protein